MIPIFPNFCKLNLRHKDVITKINTRYLPYSDFNFTSMWTYNTDDSVEISMLNNNLVVKFVDYINLKPFYSFLGDNEILNTVNTLLSHAKENDVQSFLKLVPESVIAVDPILSSKYEVIEDIDNHDYIISIDEIVELNPDKYKRKRNLVEQFKKRYPTYEIKQIDLKNSKSAKEIIEFFMIWEKINDKERSDTQNELKAIRRLIESLDKLEVYTLGIYHNEKMIGFNIYERVHKNYSISAFQKADKSYMGIFAMLSHEVAKHLKTLECKLINYEQDLGIDGLRLSKSLWKPTHFLKKYIITFKI